MKKHLRKLVAIFLVCLMVAAIVACGEKTTDADNITAADGSSASSATDGGSGDSGDSANAARDTLNVAVSLDPGTLDPVYMTGKGGYLSVLATYCEPLWYYTLDGEKVWVLATAYDQIGELEFTLKIREGVTFSNGNPLTAEDVWHTMQVNSADSRAWLNVKAIDFEKTHVVDDYTIDVWYTAFNAAQEVGFPQMLILDAESYDPAEMAIRPVGTGAYTVTEYIVNSYVTCEARDDYWGEAPAIKTINFKCLSEESQRVNALETGDVDFSLVPLKDIEYVESLGVSTEVLNVGSCMTALYNMSDTGLLNSIEAREAVSYAINCQAIVDVAYDGQSSVLGWGASEHLMEMQDRYLNMSDIYTDRYNVEKGTALAEQAGLTGETLRIVTYNEEKYITAAEIIQNGLEGIGVVGEIITYDQATFFTFLSTENEYDIAIFNPVAPGNMPCDVFGNYPVWISQDWSGDIHDEYIAIGAEANATADQSARQDLVYDLLAIMSEQCVWFGLCEDPTGCAFNSDLQNIVIDNTGVWYCQYMNF